VKSERGYLAAMAIVIHRLSSACLRALKGKRKAAITFSVCSSYFSLVRIKLSLRTIALTKVGSYHRQNNVRIIVVFFSHTRTFTRGLLSTVVFPASLTRARQLFVAMWRVINDVPVPFTLGWHRTSSQRVQNTHGSPSLRRAAGQKCSQI
jgi:hypothetical protein